MRSPDGIHVDWSAIGRASTRLTYVGSGMADLLSAHDDEANLTIGIEKAGAPLATVVAQELDTEIAAYAPSKHRWEEERPDDLEGSFSRNFADVSGRDCYIVDDTVTSGTTLRETINAVRNEGGNPTAAVVVVDKQGLDRAEGVSVYSLINVIPVDQ